MAVVDAAAREGARTRPAKTTPRRRRASRSSPSGSSPQRSRPRPPGVTRDGFDARVDTIDALAGLAIGAFIVDRLLTFVPPIFVAGDARQRAIDLTVLRFGYGAAIGAVFVILTNLQAIAALTGDDSVVDPRLDRAVAVLAIAGGVAGLARLWSGINPQPATDVDAPATDGKRTATGTAAPQPTDASTSDKLPPPTRPARLFGLAMVIAGAAWAFWALGDDRGIELLGPDQPAADGTIAVVVRFGVVLLAAAIVQQATELVDRLHPVPKENKPVVLGGVAVLLGVIAARVFDLYLLHNIGFFGVTDAMKIDTTGLAGSAPASCGATRSSPASSSPREPSPCTTSPPACARRPQPHAGERMRSHSVHRSDASG